jgi:hypothetical protein
MADKNQNEFPAIMQYFLFIFSAGLYLLLTTISDFKSQMTIYYLIITPLYFIYFYVVLLILKKESPNPLSFRWIIFFAVLFRLCVLIARPPSLGLNMFLFVETYDYATALLLKLVLLFIEIGLYIILGMLINYFSLARHRMALLMLNPLIILETYYFIQIGIAGVLLFWLAILLFFRKRAWGSIPFFSCASCAAGFSIMAAVPFLIKKFWYKLLFLLAFSALLLWMVYRDVIPTDLYSNQLFMGIFYSIYFIIKEGTAAAVQVAPDAGSDPFYYGAAILILSTVMVDLLKKMKRFEAFHSVVFLQGSFIIMGVTLLLLPGLSPWYLLWILPYMIYLPRWAWLGFTFFIQFSYAGVGEALYILSWPWLLVIYLPFLILLLLEYHDRRNLKGWFP